ncbi:hypothetical protein FJ364_05710, partial [Candidatus Dependentiae bacterium]|nr:hypothetical protein [Candidatus Dependentiae bacterium]
MQHRMIKPLFCLSIVFLSLTSCAQQEVSLLDQAGVESCLRGCSPEEIRLIEKDLQIVRDICFDDVVRNQPRTKEKRYIATAGAPGARKSTILERFLRSTHATDV